MRLGRRKIRHLNLALQGGGAHGAFTWGVLHRLLNEADVRIGWLSGTSSGAVNAICVAHGLAHRDPAAGQLALERIWQGVERAGIPDLLRLNPFLVGLVKAAPMPSLSALLSPYEFNPGGFDPLRKILSEHIDFEAIRTSQTTEILLAATDVATGRARLFRRREMTVDVVLASACLPSLNHAVEIDGRFYWDGGFSANPDLLALATECPIKDTLLVQLNPIHKSEIPRDTKGIEDRVNTITFNQPLLRDIETIIMAQQMRTSWFASRNNPLRHIKTHRFHLIAAGRHTAGLGAESKVVPDLELLSYLHGSGRTEASRWLEQHKASIGRRGTVNLRNHYLEPTGIFAPRDNLDAAAGPDDNV
ncbi:MAG: patatin-like phospholipase family protein [Hyphomicrobiaceae bacterium]